jgi:hypothetical protein
MVKLEIFSLLLLTVIISFLFGYQLFTDREKKQKDSEIKSKSTLNIDNKPVLSEQINQIANPKTLKVTTGEIKSAAAALALAPSLNNAPHLKFNPNLCPNATMFGRPHKGGWFL